MSALGDSPDNLIPFLELVFSNQRANLARYPGPSQILRRVNICLSTAGKNLVNPKPVMAGVFFLRCQYAFKAAVGMALSGQVCEAFVMMRSCLEYAGYALIIFRDPSQESVFTNRHVDAAGMKANRATFHVGTVKEAIAAYDTKLAVTFETLYQRTIDFGGHPNPHATFSAMEMADDELSFDTLALVTEPKILLHAMKSVAQVGLAALFIFQHIFKAKFELLGIRSEMDRLRQENL